ncbi:hypothetical protein ACQCVB_17310 [Fictibacillus phosphorivorans]|uniref:hypothetical protein n=1 Tax=Fictibacillus phosphorivorans TaxID=1221500 RepID=UPI003CE801D5
MNLYYLEKMMEMKKREMEQLAKESSSNHTTNQRKSELFIKSLFSKKKATQSNQVCCA